ncbi:MAG: hypothetical protein CMA64_00605 [Euryarchaeota archaeon]|jgi:hypothetical protein|nr:hypothetical protein [Euryarchaeota archaeon]
MKILCIGNGVSLRNNLHIVNDTYDYKIGTKYQYREFKVDCIAVADKDPAETISEDYTGDIITKWNTRDNFIIPSTADEEDITGTLQMKYAVDKGATEVHTVGFDCLSNRLNKDKKWSWVKPTPWDMDNTQQAQWDMALIEEWKSKMKSIEYANLKIKWRHFL